MKKQKIRPIHIILLIIAVIVLAISIFLFASGKKLSFFSKENDVPTFAPVAISSAVKVFTLNVENQPLFGTEKTIEQQKAGINTAIDFAVQNGFGAVLWQGANKNEQFFRKNAENPADFIKTCDEFLFTWDPLTYFCQTASDKKISALVYFDEGTITEEDALKLSTAYPVSGVYINKGDLGAEFGNFVKVGTEEKLLSLTPISNYLSFVKTSKQSDFAGLIFDEYNALTNNLSAYSSFASVFNNTEKAVGVSFTPKKSLSLTYPTDTSKQIYTETCFIMGTSDPTKTLSLNGAEIVRNGVDGTFGVKVSLNLGANSFVLAQGEETIEFALTRGSSTYVPNPNAEDATVALAPGQVIEVSSTIASALFDAASDDNINETIKMGTKATVLDSVRTTRSGKKSWAYLLESGDFILAKNAKLAENPSRASFTGTSLQTTENGETFTFTGSGTPLIYTLLKDNVLTITTFGADFADGFTFEGSQFITATEKIVDDKAIILKLTINPQSNLWGWDINFKDGTTQLFLKSPPKLSDKFALPLSGVRVVLDPGHGQDDGGAMGSAGAAAPAEKDVNLAVALSGKQYLEQMGATVIMSRSDDTFITLDGRLTMISTEQPDFFISVHHNSVDLTVDANESSGTECYYFYKWHKPIADSLSANVAKMGERNNREAKYGYYYVTRSTAAPSVMLETGFMVNPAEYEKLTDNSIIDLEGAAIAQSVLENIPK